MGVLLLRLLSVRIKELQFLVRSLNTVDCQMGLRRRDLEITGNIISIL